MNLDISALDKLKGNATQKPQNSPLNEIYPEEDKHTPLIQSSEKKAIIELENIQTKQMLYQTICKEYHQNRILTETLQAEIVKGTRAGEDIQSLFLKAVKVISAMTSNPLFYSRIEEGLQARSGTTE